MSPQKTVGGSLLLLVVIGVICLCALQKKDGGTNLRSVSKSQSLPLLANASTLSDASCARATKDTQKTPTDNRLTTKPQGRMERSSNEKQMLRSLQRKLLEKISESKRLGTGEVISAWAFGTRNRSKDARSNSSHHEKISPVLLNVEDQPENTAPSSYPRYDNKGRILVKIKYNPQDISEPYMEEVVEEQGGSVYAHIHREGILEAYMPNDKLDHLASYSWVVRIDPVGPAIARMGSVLTEGDFRLDVDLA